MTNARHTKHYYRRTGSLLQIRTIITEIGTANKPYTMDNPRVRGYDIAVG